MVAQLRLLSHRVLEFLLDSTSSHVATAACPFDAAGGDAAFGRLTGGRDTWKPSQLGPGLTAFIGSVPGTAAAPERASSWCCSQPG